MATIADLGEWGLIAALRSRFGDGPAGWVGIGDDAAVGRLTPGLAVLTSVDLLVEGVHFRRETTSGADLGHKALAVNLSDLAAMGARPAWAVVGLALPDSLPVDWLLDFYQGLGALALATGTHLVGGDTVRANGGLTIAVTVIGEAERPLLRRGGQAGDVLFTTGPAGQSAAGLWCLTHPALARELPPGLVAESLRAHTRPEPELALGRTLAGTGLALRLLDSSDGLARSALLLAEQGEGVDACLVPAQLPISPATRAVAARAGVDPLDWALDGGEDYTLVGSVTAQDWPLLQAALPGALQAIGHLEAGTGVGWRGTGPGRQPLAKDKGYQHFGR